MKKDQINNLDSIDKAIFQILVAYRCVEGSVLNILLDKVKEDFQNFNESIDVIFKRMNDKLRRISMEVKSVLIKNMDTSNLLYYHGLVNQEEDNVAKDYGNYFNPTELQFFSKIVMKLVEVHYMNSADIGRTCKPENWSISQMDTLLTKFLSEGWLQKNCSNFWIIGARSYLELQSYMEKLLLSSEPDQEDNRSEEVRAQQVRQQLPQVIVY